MSKNINNNIEDIEDIEDIGDIKKNNLTAVYQTLDIKKLMDTRRNFSMIIYGKRRSGKSLLVRDLLSQINDWYKNAYVFSETIFLQPDLFDFIPLNNRFNGFNQDKMIEIWDKQEKYIIEAIKTQPDKSKLDMTLMIFDDVINDKYIRSSSIFNKFFTMGRHCNICVIVLSQEVGGKEGISKVCRRNSDLIGSFFLESEYDRELLSSQFLSGKTKKEGMNIITEITTPSYQSMIFDCTSLLRDFSDFVYLYKAEPDISTFMIGKSTGTGKKTSSSSTFKDPLLLRNGTRLDPSFNVGSVIKPRIKKKF